MSKAKFTTEQVIQALEQSKGVQTVAARSLGCSRATIQNYISRYPTVKAAYDDINETTIDFVESQLLKKIQSGDTTCIIYFLKTKARHRGYAERHYHRTENYDIDLSKLTDEQLARVANGEDVMQVVLDGYINSD